MTTSTNIRERIQTTIDSISRFLRGNEAIAQQARDWHATPNCTIHNTLQFRDIAKVQAGLAEEDCYTCALCSIEEKRERLAPHPHPINSSPTYHGGDLLLPAIQAERARQQAAIQQLIERIPTRHTEEMSLSEIIAPQRTSTANPVDNSLILWPGGDEDETERMLIVRKPKANDMNDTKEVPALEKLSWFLQAPIHKQGTGEQEKLEKVNWMV